jgi:hypothetical protein
LGAIIAVLVNGGRGGDSKSNDSKKVVFYFSCHVQWDTDALGVASIVAKLYNCKLYRA